MTVAELIKALEAMPQDAVVIVQSDQGPDYEATEVELHPCYVTDSGTVRWGSHLALHRLEADAQGIVIT